MRKGTNTSERGTWALVLNEATLLRRQECWTHFWNETGSWGQVTCSRPQKCDPKLSYGLRTRHLF